MLRLNSEFEMTNISEKESFPVDRISSLPDFILSHILSFLPSTKHSVKTSIFSKRWRHLWTCVDKLVFCNIAVKTNIDHRPFLKFVSNVLDLHQFNIKEFTLCWDHKSYSQVNKDITWWIDTAIAKGVETLDLEVSTNFDFMFPLSVFSCRTLTVLTLKIAGRIDLNFPSSPIFPCLKKLSFNLSETQQTEFFERILSQCSTLELLRVTISGPPIIDVVLSSVKRLWITCSGPASLDKEIILGVPSLEYLRINSELPPELIVTDELSSLIEADISLVENQSSPDAPYVDVNQLRDAFARFMEPLYNVKVLRLTCRFQKALKSINLCRFHNLTKLDIVSEFLGWSLLVSLLESSINLEAITLRKLWTLRKHNLRWRDPRKVPTCLSSSLRNISIKGYSDDDDLPMVKYILRNAQRLEWVNIHCAADHDRDINNNNWKSDMLQILQKLPRACERCQFSVV